LKRTAGESRRFAQAQFAIELASSDWLFCGGFSGRLDLIGRLFGKEWLGQALIA
jgi:hypothetical protein